MIRRYGSLMIMLFVIILVGCKSKEQPKGAKQKTESKVSDIKTGAKTVDSNKISAITDQPAKKANPKGARIDESAKTSTTIQVGQDARLFQAKTFDGKEFNLADYKGKYVLLDFWATWCRPCQAELPFLGKLATQYKDSDKFAIIGISLDSDANKIPPFVQKYGINYPHVFDGKVWHSGIAQMYGVSSIPFTVLIDPQMKVTHVGLRGEKLIQTIETLVK